jgi:chemotaxis-related protein WspB
VSDAGFEDRLLVFEVGETAFALPIAEVLEVTEVGRVHAVPSLPSRVAGVVNHHGDALPVVERNVLFEASGAGPAEHLLVLSGGEAHGNLGVPVDRIRGLVAGGAAAPAPVGGGPERRALTGRVVSILDTRRLLARAAAAIARAAERGGAGASQGGNHELPCAGR